MMMYWRTQKYTFPSTCNFSCNLKGLILDFVIISLKSCNSKSFVFTTEDILPTSSGINPNLIINLMKMINLHEIMN